MESYAADGAVEEARERARQAALLEPGVQYVRSTFVPADEFVLHVFEAPSAEALHRAGRRAALQYQRIVEAMEGEQ